MECRIMFCSLEFCSCVGIKIIGERWMSLPATSSVNLKPTFISYMWGTGGRRKKRW